MPFILQDADDDLDDIEDPETLLERELERTTERDRDRERERERDRDRRERDRDRDRDRDREGRKKGHVNTVL